MSTMTLKDNNLAYTDRLSVKYQLINGVNLGYIGSLADDSVIVVTGRNDYKKNSMSLDSLVKDLHLTGHSVCWFEAKRTQTAKFLDNQFQSLCNSKIANFCQRNPMFGRLLKKLIKAALLLKKPMQWDYFLPLGKNEVSVLANELCQLLRCLPARDVFLFSHSAGGIVASLVESEPNVKKIVCFGYPFKHPDKSEEPIRTAHLIALKKPMLIIQGEDDEYGTAKDVQRYNLSESIRVFSVQSDHDYANLGAVEYQRCLSVLKDFYSIP